MFRLAEQWGWRPANSNPCQSVTRYKENKNERFLSSTEIAHLGGVLNAIDHERREHPSAIAAIRMLLLTGARPSEIIESEWKHVDLERQLLLLPDSKIGKRSIYLNGAATGILKHQVRNSGSSYVFAGKTQNRPI